MNIQRLCDLLRTRTCCKHLHRGCTTEKLAGFPEIFNAKNVRHGWYDIWEKNNYFATGDKNNEPIRMILPPPNITGVLHLGHALTVTIQDALARWYRMKGHPVVWVPGIDHAGIATQTMIERHLHQTKGISKSDLTKEEFLKYIWEWKDEKENTIRDQMRTLGASVDWSKEYFTMSKNHSDIVTKAFVMLNQQNMIYREKSLINWSPTLGSVVSDIEVDYIKLTEKTAFDVPGYKDKVIFGQIWEIAYPVKDSKDELIVATTRPETLMGDVALAVHPEDERYTKYIGKHVWHPLRETYIPVISNSLVDRDFGTGIVKITPAHDHTDYTIAQQHQCDRIDIIDESGNISSAGKQFEGLPRFTAREKILQQLANQGLLKRTVDHKMTLPRCSRSNDIIEYLLKEQWFIKCKSMAERALQAVKEDSLRINPPLYEELWNSWLYNIKDWCVSRQLWWGHRIPAYNVTYDNSSEWIIAECEKDAIRIAEEKYGSNIQIHQDNDVLDTWFSSGILPFTTMGWPNKEFEKNYPLTLLETGHDIIFFWVARMVMLSLQLTDRLPFKEIVLHGVLCDIYKKKMSKSTGNIILPEHIIDGISLQDLHAQTKQNYAQGILLKSEFERTLAANTKMFPDGIPECGVDALRLTLCGHNIKGHTINFNVVECREHKFFCNKIWQASKYLLFTINKEDYKEPTSLTVLDRWILSCLSMMVETVNDAFAQRDFYKAVRAIKQFMYQKYCDFYLEGTKYGFKSEDADVIASHTHTLIKCMETSLRALAPLAPYIADDLYEKLSNRLPGFLTLASLLQAPYPSTDEFSCLKDASLEKNMEKVIMLISDINSVSANLSKKSISEAHIIAKDQQEYDIYKENTNLIKGVCRIFNISIFREDDYVTINGSIAYSSPNHSIFILIRDADVLKKIENNIRATRNNTKQKLEKLQKNRTIKKEARDDKIRQLQEKLERLPIVR
ncbi:hypothetical protein KM043_010775 [Ampulex compressa]|nr:hypothetical protein KM043_010775 [Ampulex compressa]